MKRVACLLGLWIGSQGLSAQKVSGVTARQEGQNILVNYHLETTSTCSIQLWMSENGGESWTMIKDGLSGDLTGVSKGDRTILWNVLSSREQLVGSDVVFKVKLVSSKGQLLVGQEYQGGIVAYIFEPGDAGYKHGQVHGLIAAPQDLPKAYPWGCYKQDISGADRKVIGWGAQNTLDIVHAGCEGAALACADLVLNGYSDWFLPSNDELSKLYESRNSIGNFKKACYWSSTELNSACAWRFFFDGGYSSTLDKDYVYYVRAVRAF